MTRTRSLLLSLFVLTIAACGGRSTLHVEQAIDGGGYSEAGTADGKRDGVTGIDGSVSSDAATDAAPDGVADLSSPDDSLADRGPSNDRPGDGGTFPGDGGQRTDGSDVLIRQTDASDSGRSEVSTGGPDAGDAAAVTLTSIEIDPPSPITVNVGTPRTLKVTANYSDNTSKDVSSSATVISANTSILTVSGTTLTGSGTTVTTTTITVTYGTQTLTATITVNGTNPLVSISIDNVPTTSLAIGATATLAATGVFKDGTHQDITADATWDSSATSYATVGNTTGTKGVVTAVAEGSFYVTATVGTIVGTSITMTVKNTKLLSIGITSQSGSTALQRGLTNQVFIATGTYDDNSTGDVTQAATWASSDTSVLTVVPTGATAGYVTTVGRGTADLTATVGSIVGKLTVTVTNGTLRSITVKGPSLIVLGNSGTYSYTATGNYSDNSQADLTSSVNWSSDDQTILTVSNASATAGQATPVGTAGKTNIKATSGTVTGSLAVTVSTATLISITLTPTSISSLIVGLNTSITATGLYGDSSDTNTQFSIDVTSVATWTVDSTHATVGNGDTAGVVTGVSAGTANVKATLSGKSATAPVTVIDATLLSIAVSPSEASVRASNTYPFTAKGTYDNGSIIDITDSVTWTSSDTTIATISNASGSKGVATGVAASSTVVTITAAKGSVTGTAKLTVTEAKIVSIQIQPQATQTIQTGATYSYTINAIYENGTSAALQTGVTWKSSNTAVATVADSTSGGGPFGGGTAGATATGVAAGKTSIEAAYTTSDGTALSDQVTLVVTAAPSVIGIRITPTSATIKVGATQDYTVYADYDDGSETQLTTGVTLQSSNGTVASVSSGGGGFGGGGGLSATGLAEGGPITITASYTTNGTTFTKTSSLTVTKATTVVSLYISPPSATVLVNGTQQFRAYAVDSSGNATEVTTSSSTEWTTDDGTKATITTGSSAGGRGAVFTAGGGGLATGLAAGDVTITAVYTTSDGSFSATAKLTVKNPTPTGLSLNPTSAAILVNGTQTFQATLSYDDGSNTNVTSSASWKTSDPTVVVMSTAAGLAGGGGGVGIVGGATATGLAAGRADVQATYTVGTTTFTATAPVTVTDPVPSSLEIQPTTPTVYLSSGGGTQQFTAIVIFTNDTKATVTNSTDWKSESSDVASISTTGLATGLKTGASLIDASYTRNGVTVTASTQLTVADRTITSLEIQPILPTIHLGLTQSFIATAVYDNGTTATVTGSATWVSAKTSVATITTSTGGGLGGGSTTAGVATPVASGTTKITATFGGYSASTDLTVSSGTLSSITITPSPLTVAVVATQQLKATGNYSDNLTEDLTNVAIWSSTDSVATVSNASGSIGLLKGVSANTAHVKATFQSVTGTLDVIIN